MRRSVHDLEVMDNNIGEVDLWVRSPFKFNLNQKCWLSVHQKLREHACSLRTSMIMFRSLFKAVLDGSVVRMSVSGA